MKIIENRELGLLLGEYQEDLIQFLAGVLCGPPFLVLEHCVELLSQSVVKIPRGISPRAALLQQAHATSLKISPEAHGFGPELWTQVAMRCWTKDDKLSMRLVELNALSRLTRTERCAVMLDRRGLDPAERRYILEREFSVDPVRYSTTERNALKVYEDQLWGVEQAATFEGRIISQQNAIGIRASERWDTARSLVELIAATPLVSTANDERVPLYQRLTEVIKIVVQSDGLDPGPRLLQVDATRAYSMFDVLLDKHGLTWTSGSNEESLHHLVMLTYHHTDEDSVRRLHDELEQNRPRLAPSSQIWVDWLRLRDLRGPGRPRAHAALGATGRRVYPPLGPQWKAGRGRLPRDSLGGRPSSHRDSRCPLYSGRSSKRAPLWSSANLGIPRELGIIALVFIPRVLLEQQLWISAENVADLRHPTVHIVSLRRGARLVVASRVLQDPREVSLGAPNPATHGIGGNLEDDATFVRGQSLPILELQHGLEIDGKLPQRD